MINFDFGELIAELMDLLNESIDGHLLILVSLKWFLRFFGPRLIIFHLYF